MTKILKNDELDRRIREYYIEHYGEREEDVWLGHTAANVCLFQREGKTIALKCHILTGGVVGVCLP